MMRQQSVRVALAIAGFGLVGISPSMATAQPYSNPSPQATTPAATAQQPAANGPSAVEIALLRSLHANPATAPYQFATQRRGPKVALQGRVGTKVIHDVAIQTAIVLNVPVIDEVVIDTLAAHQANAVQQGLAGGPGMGQGLNYGMAGPSSGLGGYPGAGGSGSLPFTYPQPLFGRLDDPFFGFEPPAIGYPPWWGALTYNRVGPPPAQNQLANPQPVAVSNANGQPNFNQVNMAGNAPINVDDAAATNLPYGTIDMAIDPRGVATLRGTVPTLAERITLGQKVAQTPGVTQVINLLNVKAAAQQVVLSDRPPPPPVPVDFRPVPAQNQNLNQVPNPPALLSTPDLTPIQPETDAVGLRASKAIASKSGIANPSVKVKVRDGVASLTGKVPSVYEAMIAFRAVQRTPGVREIEDRLEFVVPDGSGINPLAEKGKPEDIEPYLEAQIRRQMGDLAHIDRIRVQGEALEIKGTLEREEDRPRFDAIIRSMPILRGFKISAEVPAEAH